MYQATNRQTKEVKSFKSRGRCNGFIDRKNEEYGAYLWSYIIPSCGELILWS